MPQQDGITRFPARDSRLPRNTPPVAKFDAQEVFIFLRPEETAVVSVHVLMHGITPPPGVSFQTWRDVRKARLDAISWAEFGCIADACPGLISDLHDMRSAMREVR